VNGEHASSDADVVPAHRLLAGPALEVLVEVGENEFAVEGLKVLGKKGIGDQFKG